MAAWPGVGARMGGKAGGRFTAASTLLYDQFYGLRVPCADEHRCARSKQRQLQNGAAAPRPAPRAWQPHSSYKTDAIRRPAAAGAMAAVAAARAAAATAG